MLNVLKLNNKNPQDMKNSILAKHADILKNTDKGVNKMSEVMEQLIKEVTLEQQKEIEEIKLKAEMDKAKAQETILNYQRAFKLAGDMRRMGIPESEISRTIEETFGIAA